MITLSHKESLILPLDPPRALLVFHLAGQLAAVPLENVERIAPMTQLARPTGMPSPLEGILNLAGTAVPVVRLDRLLQLPVRRPGLYSMLIVLKGISDRRIALLVDRVSEILSVPASGLLPVRDEDSFNACAEATVSVRGEIVHLLSPTQILLEKERETLSEFQAMAQRRLQDWASE
jgi:purine-binding chemotaxis protein CheW